MSDMFLGSQTPMYQNVRICRRNKNGKILEERYAKNRVTRLMLYGIGKFLLGHFNDSSPDKIYEFIPRYLALGTNTPGLDADSAGVSTLSTVNDTRLLNEITKSSSIGSSETVKRIWIAERNMCKLNTKFSDPFIKISIKTYISSSQYDGMSIGEAGLFSKEKDNNCLARVCFTPFTKNPEEVLDIQWDITLLSYGETKYPDSLDIANGPKVSIPLNYTNKYFKEINIGLTRYPLYDSIGRDTLMDMFEYDNDGILYTKYSKEEIKHKSGWYEYLTSVGMGDMFELFFEALIDSQLNDASNDGQNAKFLISINQSQEKTIPNLFHFGNLYTNLHTKVIDKDSLVTTLLYVEDKYTDDEKTNGRYFETNISGEYIIVSDNDKTKYKVMKNRFYKRNAHDNTLWEETPYFMYNGIIITNDYKTTDYTYKNGYFYKTKTTKIDTYINQYLNFSGTTNDKFFIFNVDSYNTIQPNGYSIDVNNDYVIYLNNEKTDYHLSFDNYWVNGDYIKLIPQIIPSDSTDKSVTWRIQNKDVAHINWNGVVTAWNIGETVAIASTSNDLRSKCIIDVVKNEKYIDVDTITITPVEAVLSIDENPNNFIIISAEVLPLIATNNTVTWSASSEISKCISLINLGNNQVKIILNGSGNIGAGYVTATSQNGKSASCFVRITYKGDYECDCPDPSHLIQEG